MNQLVSRKVCDTKPVTVEYTSTEYAGTLKEVIDAMIRWGQNHKKKIIGRQQKGPAVVYVVILCKSPQKSAGYMNSLMF